MSAGLIRSSGRLAMPSTTTSGLLLPSVFEPRIRMVAPVVPGSPPGVTTDKPGSRPTRLLEILVAGDRLISSPFTVAMAPVSVAFFCVPYDITTVSSSLTSKAKEIVICFLLPTAMVCVVKPTDDISSSALSPTSVKVNVPSAAVNVPLLLPFTFMETPGTGLPSGSIIFPFISTGGGITGVGGGSAGSGGGVDKDLTTTVLLMMV